MSYTECTCSFTSILLLQLTVFGIENAHTLGIKIWHLIVGSNVSVVVPDLLRRYADTDHVSAIMSKAARRIWFLKKLKRAGASVDIAYYYQAVIRPVMEYASPVWHSNLTKRQTKTLEDVQRRAVQIINGNIPYEEACRLLNILLLADRRLELCRTLFQQIMRDDTHVLHHLLPPKRDTWPADYDLPELIQQFMQGLVIIKTLLSYMD